jgi:predicted component of type VI protein secretion system
MPTNMIRNEIRELVGLGRFPTSHEAKMDVIKRQETLLRSIQAPVSDEEAKCLIKLFGVDDYFDLAWTVLHLIETAPGWPIEECLKDSSNEWIVHLRERAQRGRAAQRGQK